MTLPITGDITKNVAVKEEGVTLHNMPMVLLTHLQDAEARINIYQHSGKRLGAQVVAVDSLTSPTTAELYIATGREPTDDWKVLSTLLGTTAGDVTPAVA